MNTVNKPFIAKHLSTLKIPPLAMNMAGVEEDFCRYFNHTLGWDKSSVSSHHVYASCALVMRDRLVERWRRTQRAYDESGCKQAYYLSLEFLMGRALGNALLNLDLEEASAKALRNLGLELEEVQQLESDAGLGNGGLGRLAACFLDSCATLQLPVTGYGIRYEYGMFRQKIEHGQQLEEPDHWLRNGNPWEIERPECALRVKFCGHSDFHEDVNGRTHVRWVDTQDVVAVPYDVPIPGYRNETVNTLRLWKAAATEEFNLDEFNAGSYTEAVAAKNAAEHITMVLYPNDASENGKELRLRQQYFLASASLQDVLRQWVEKHGENFSRFADRNCFQLNDTHPTCAVPELMRLLMDEHGLHWEEAWDITSRTMAYTNHTLLPEALERWPVSMFGRLLPRLRDIIFEINARFMKEVSLRWPGDTERERRMSIVEEGNVPQIRMAYLAVVACHSVNGVAALHSRLLQQLLFHDFFDLWPHKFNNKTNGVTPRRWLVGCNRPLAAAIERRIGGTFATRLEELEKLAPLADDEQFQAELWAIKRGHKVALARM
ncbi:MAG: glycogen/starch/alpha-glucan family phosphorylase, partial [Gallionellaceae bacterium]|nr:glycogen/starch/alpha-glucan family phosphorylase [Gallionellaceae bacterium]